MEISDRSDLKSTLATVEPQPQNREEEPVIAELSVATENSQLLAELHGNSCSRTSSATKNPRSNMELVEHRFDDLSRLQYRVFTCSLGGKHNCMALVLKFSGVYGIGSAGNGDAEFMQVITCAASAAWRSHAVVFDLRDLAYEWGDAIWRVFGRGIEPSGVEGLPCALVVSDLCRGGFSTCAGIVPPMFDDLDSAIAFVAEPARAELDQLFADLDGDGERHEGKAQSQ